MSREARIKFYRKNEETPFPCKAHPTDSGFDVFWWDPDKLIKTVAVSAQSIFCFHTGIYVSFSYGYELQIRSKSGLAGKGIIVANSPGTVDYGYTGELLVLLANIGHMPIEISKGQKIAQLVLSPLPTIHTEEYISITPEVETATGNPQFLQERLKQDFPEAHEQFRGEGKLGSTGDF